MSATQRMTMGTVRRGSRWRRFVGLLGAASLVVAACSSGDDDESSTPTPPTTDQVEVTVPEATVADDTGTGDETPGTEAPEDTSTTVPSGPVQVVKIGYAFPDLAAFATLNKAFGIGNPELQAEAVIDGWRRDGMLPPGIDIELVAAPYNIIDRAAKQGTCTALAEDEQVFAVVSGISFTIGAECLSTRFATPVIDTDGAPPSLYELGAPSSSATASGRSTEVISTESASVSSTRRHSRKESQRCSICSNRPASTWCR